MRIGIGYDVHAFVTGRPLILGGVQIPYAQGLAGHSDADAVIHAVVDALLGAAALGDIGQHFPSSDPRWRDTPSTTFLAYTRDLLAQHGWRIGNIDATIVAERPKMAPSIPAMKAVLAEALAVTLDAVSIKATTTDSLGFTGRGEGIAAMAIAAIERT
jgi:2-C-methyl-D-erythritol 2,4-cyclodiphosphate synthase